MIRSSTPHSAASQPPSNSLAAHGTPWGERRGVKCATLYQARHTQPPLARSLTASHGSPLGGGQRTQRCTILSHRSLARSPTHVSRLATGEREGTQGAPSQPTFDRSIACSPAHVSRLATGEKEGTPPKVCHTQPPFGRPLARQFTSHGHHWSHGGDTRGPYPTTVRSLTRSPIQVSRFATEKEGGNTRGAIRNHRSFAHSFATSGLTVRH